MTDYKKLKANICKEIEEFVKKDHYSMTDIEIMDKLVNTVKNIDKINKYEEDSSEYAYDDGSYRSMRSYDGASGRRGRDSMGRYTSRDSGEYYSERSYGKDSMITKLNELMGEAVEKSDKDAIRRCLSQIQNG